MIENPTISENAPSVPKKSKSKPKAKKEKGLDEITGPFRDFSHALAQALRVRAEDTASLQARSGPNSIDAVRMAFLHLADILDGADELRVEPRPVLKRLAQ